jgi:hypothetical protein
MADWVQVMNKLLSKPPQDYLVPGYGWDATDWDENGDITSEQKAAQDRTEGLFDQIVGNLTAAWGEALPAGEGNPALKEKWVARFTHDCIWRVRCWQRGERFALVCIEGHHEGRYYCLSLHSR